MGFPVIWGFQFPRLRVPVSAGSYSNDSRILVILGTLTISQNCHVSLVSTFFAI